jgi:hypothetical protein
MNDNQTSRPQNVKDVSYFSVDRRGCYEGVEALILHKNSPAPGYKVGTETSVTPAATVEEISAHLVDLFPDGLSLHGWDYLTRHRSDTDVSTGKVPQDTSVELVLEFIRRSKFPDHHSRLQSYFAFSDIGQARAFSQNSGGKPIYRLSADRVLRLDWNWLRFGRQAAFNTYAASKYWSGAATASPNWEYLLAPPVRVLERV